MTLTQITKIRGAGIHTTSNIVSHNINSSGIITATAFIGDGSGLIGVASTDNIVTGTAATFNNAVNINGDLDVDGHTNLDNISVAGVSTFSGDATFSGNVSIGGTLTYEDVTNIDSVGLITARNGVFIPDTKKLEVGNAAGSGDLKIHHTSGNSFIENGTGTLKIRGATIELSNPSAAQMLQANSTASVNLYFNGSKKFETSGSGATVTGDITISDKIIHAGDTDTCIRFPGTDIITMERSGSEVFRVDSSGLKIPDKLIHQGDIDTFLEFGTDTINFDTGGTERLRIDSSGEIRIANTNFSANASGDELILGTTSNSRGITIASGNSSGNSGNIFFADSGSNTAGRISYEQDNDELVFYTGTTERTRITASGVITKYDTKNVSIRTASNSTRGHLQSNGNGIDLQAWVNSSGFITFSTNGGSGSPDERLRIDSDGNIGVNNTNPAAYGKFVVNGTANIISLNASSGAGSLSFFEGGQGRFYLKTLNGSKGLSFVDGDNSTERLRITSGGLLLLGSSTSDLSGNHRFISVGSRHAFQYGASSGTYLSFIMGSANGNVTLETSARSGNYPPLLFKVGGSERLRIDSAGNMGLGVPPIAPGHTTLHIGNSASNQPVRLHMTTNTTGAGASDGFSLSIDGSSSAVNLIQRESADMIFYTAGTERLTIASGGKATFTEEIATPQDYPNQRPRVDWNFVKVKKLDPRITYLRSGPASYVDEFGIVKMVGDNVPRFDHDSETGESRGLLIEPGRTSRLTQSTHNDAYSHFRQYDRGAIIKGPDGVENSAREYTVDSNGGTGGTTTIWANQAIGIADATSFSCFVKITRGSTMGFRFFDNNNNKESEKWTISGGAITDGSYATVVQSDPGSTEGTSSYELYPNGWVRCRWENVSAPGGNATSYLQLYIWDHAAANSDGDNIGYAVWGFQVENGAFCTSPIYKPTTAAVSRGSDFAYLDGTVGTEFDDIYKKQEGTFIIDWFNNPQGNLNDGYVFTVDDGTGNNRIGAVNSNNYQVTVTSGGSSQGTRDLGSINSGDNKIAFTYKLNDQATSLNGSDVSVDTSCTLPTGLKYWWFGLRQGQYDLLGGYMKRIVYYPTRLPNNQLKTLSS